MLTVGIAVGGCTAASATGKSASAGSAASAAAPATGSAARTSEHAYGPPAPDPACVAALKAEQTLGTRQGKDQDNESALDRDFTDFANALSADVQEEKHPATAKAMTALATDYTDLVESQSGAAQLPDMNTVEADGTAFEKACSLFLRYVFLSLTLSGSLASLRGTSPADRMADRHAARDDSLFA
jgi:hypothetical protein